MPVHPVGALEKQRPICADAGLRQGSCRRAGYRDRPSDPGSLARGRVHPQVAAERAEPVRHVEEPRAKAAARSVESRAVSHVR